MRILSAKIAPGEPGGGDLPGIEVEAREYLALRGKSFLLPSGAPHLAVLAKEIVWHFSQLGGCWALHITRWSVRPSGEHLDLFYRYRQSHGCYETLPQAPVHLFQAAEGPEEEAAGVSILLLTLYFGWDAILFPLASRNGERSPLVEVSHQERIQAVGLTPDHLPGLRPAH